MLEAEKRNPMYLCDRFYYSHGMANAHIAMERVKELECLYSIAQ